MATRRKVDWGEKAHAQAAPSRKAEAEKFLAACPVCLDEIDALVSKGDLFDARNKAWQLIDTYWAVSPDLPKGFAFDRALPWEALLDAEVWCALQNGTALSAEDLFDALLARRPINQAQATD